MINYLKQFIIKLFLLLLCGGVVALVTGFILLFVTSSWAIITIVSCAYATIFYLWHKFMVKGLPRL